MLSLMLGVGYDPTRPYGQGILSPAYPEVSPRTEGITGAIIPASRIMGSRKESAFYHEYYHAYGPYADPKILTLGMWVL